MIVAITGSHSTGKSTIVDSLKECSNFVSLHSITRTAVTKEERKIDGINNLDSAQLKILEGIKCNVKQVIELNKQNPEKIFLMDRCVFDFVAYSRCFYKQNTLSKEVIDKIEQDYKDLFDYVDLYVYLPIEFDIVDDGVRSLDNVLRKNVDEEIQSLLEQNNVKYIKLTGDVNTRLQYLQNTINTFRNNKY